MDTTKNLKLIKWRWGEGRRDISVALNDTVFYRIMNICYQSGLLKKLPKYPE